MDTLNPPSDSASRFKELQTLQDQIIVATSALEHLKLSQQEAKGEAIKLSRKLGLAWQLRQFDCWLETSAYRDYYVLKSGQLKQKIGEQTQHIERLKQEWAELKQQSNYQEQISLAEQKFQQVLKLSQEALEDLKTLQGLVRESQP